MISSCKNHDFYPPYAEVGTKTSGQKGGICIMTSPSAHSHFETISLCYGSNKLKWLGHTEKIKPKTGLQKKYMKEKNKSQEETEEREHYI